MLVYAATIKPRLQYLLRFIADQWLGCALEFSSDAELAKNHRGLLICYHTQRLRANDYLIVPAGLMEETVTRPQQLVVNRNEKLPFFFASPGDHPFDLFSAIFYLLSRYEEYLPHEKDSYGRFDHQQSLAFREGFLSRPLVNEWLENFFDRLKLHAGEKQITEEERYFKKPAFTFLPSYDIDIAWSYRHKGFWRNLAGGLSELFRGRLGALGQRISVLSHRRRDPFDVFGWLNGLHEKLRLRPYYFFLFAPKRGRYDKNINPSKKALQLLARDHAIRYPVGIHPSWQSGDEPGLIKKEIALLETATGSSIKASRQHYIRLSIPETYRLLRAAGIAFDFSMGYGSINGFRASVALPFYWYDLEKEESTELLLFPFCFMEANSYFEQSQNAVQAFEELRAYTRAVQKTGGFFCMIWHNNFLTQNDPWTSWREAYKTYLEDVSASQILD